MCHSASAPGKAGGAVARGRPSHRGSPRYEQRYAGTAVAGEDDQATAGTLTFAPGETTKAVTVAVFTDSIAEPTETFYAAPSSASANARIVGNGVPGEIYDVPDPIWVDSSGP